jgi:hypothetical protein
MPHSKKALIARLIFRERYKLTLFRRYLILMIKLGTKSAKLG